MKSIFEIDALISCSLFLTHFCDFLLSPGGYHKPELVASCFAGCKQANNTTFRHDGDAIAEGPWLVQILRYRQNGGAGFAQPHQKLPGMIDGFGIEALGRKNRRQVLLSIMEVGRCCAGWVSLIDILQA